MKKLTLLTLALSVSTLAFAADTKPIEEVFQRYWSAYSKKDFKGTEISFTPGQRVPDLSKLDMSNEIESMKITCGK